METRETESIWYLESFVRYQVPRYSGWKPALGSAALDGEVVVRYQVPRYSGWKLGDLLHRCADVERLSDTKYRDIADGNGRPDAAQSASVNSSDTKYRDIADGNSLGIP